MNALQILAKMVRHALTESMHIPVIAFQGMQETIAK